MPRGEYSYYVTLLSCNQFNFIGGHRGGQNSHRGVMPPGHPLEPPLYKVNHKTLRLFKPSVETMPAGNSICVVTIQALYNYSFFFCPSNSHIYPVRAETNVSQNNKLQTALFMFTQTHVLCTCKW